MKIIEIDLFQGVCPNCNHLPCVCGSHTSDADDKAGYPPNCKDGYEEKDGKCVPVEEASTKKKGYAKDYPGKNVKKRKDGVPQKKMKKRACKKGEYRDKSGNLKKTKADYTELWNTLNEHQ